MCSNFSRSTLHFPLPNADYRQHAILCGDHLLISTIFLAHLLRATQSLIQWRIEHCCKGQVRLHLRSPQHGGSSQMLPEATLTATYEIQIVHLIFTASLIHIYNACTCTGAESQTALDDLQFCWQSLGEIGQTYGNATRALEVIILVKREWQKVAAVRTAQGFKRPSNTLNPQSEWKRRWRRHPQENVDPLPTSHSTRSTLSSFFMPSAFETFRVPPNDLALGSQALNAPRDGGDIYDAWDFLNWADLGVRWSATLMHLPDLVAKIFWSRMVPTSNSLEEIPFKTAAFIMRVSTSS